MTNEHIIFSYKFDGKGKASPLKYENISKEIKAKNLAWVHMDANNAETKTWLEKEISYLDPFIIEALLADETRPRTTAIGSGFLVILRGVNLNKNSDPEDMVSVRLWIDNNRIISIRKRKLKAILSIEEEIRKGNAPKNPGDFLCRLISGLSSRIAPIITELDDRTDDIEERIIDNPDKSLRNEIVHIRKQAILFRRYMAPQKEVINKLKISDSKLLNETHKRSLNENSDHLLRFIEDLDAIRERAQIIKDELANIMSDKLNKNMYILSVIAAIFLPLGFLTGLLGINVGGIPGAENSNSFYIFCGILASITLIQIVIFKKSKWF